METANSDQYLERRVDDLEARAGAAAAVEDHQAQAHHRAEALKIIRVLLGRHPGDPRHMKALAAGLYNHSATVIQLGRLGEAYVMLAEARQLYATLAKQDPREYRVRLCDVMLRIALANVAEAQYARAISMAKQALGEYQTAVAADELERQFGIVRTHVLIGQAHLLSEDPDAALEEFDAALFAAERLREEAGITGTDFDWLARAPGSFRLAAPAWLDAAVGAMELHNAAGRWGIAADAANIAMRLAGGLAASGNEAAHLRFEAIHGRARQIWWAAEHPVHAAVQRGSRWDEFLIGGAGLIRGTRLPPDITAILRLAGWAEPPHGPTDEL